MKYITTDKHPFLKDGILCFSFAKDIDGYKVYVLGTHYSNKKNGFELGDSDKKEWLKEGYIKELQEPEFTRDDVKIMSCEFAIYIFRHCTDRDESYQKLYDNWLKQRNK